MTESKPQEYLLDSLPPEKDVVREEDPALQEELEYPMAPHRRAVAIRKFRKARDRQGEILLSDMVGYAGTSAAKPLEAEDPLEAINGPTGGLTPFDQDLLLADQQRLDREFENSRPKPDYKVRTVKEIITQLRLPDIFRQPIPERVTQHKLFSDLEFQRLKTLTRQTRDEAISGNLARKIVIRSSGR